MTNVYVVHNSEYRASVFLYINYTISLYMIPALHMAYLLNKGNVLLFL